MTLSSPYALCTSCHTKYDETTGLCHSPPDPPKCGPDEARTDGGRCVSVAPAVCHSPQTTRVLPKRDYSHDHHYFSNVVDAAACARHCYPHTRHFTYAKDTRDCACADDELVLNDSSTAHGWVCAARGGASECVSTAPDALVGGSTCNAPAPPVVELHSNYVRIAGAHQTCKGEGAVVHRARTREECAVHVTNVGEWRDGTCVSHDQCVLEPAASPRDLFVRTPHMAQTVAQRRRALAAAPAPM